MIIHKRESRAKLLRRRYNDVVSLGIEKVRCAGIEMPMELQKMMLLMYLSWWTKIKDHKEYRWSM